MAAEDLTYKQRLFVAAYLGKANGNATEAARIAGYAKPNQQGPRLLVKVGIREAIDAKLAAVAMSSDEILARLSDHASADMGDFIRLDAHGTPFLDLRSAKKTGKLRLLRKVSPTEFGHSIELHDAQSALVTLGKYYGLWDGDKAPKDTGEGPRKRIIMPGSGEAK